MPMIEPPTTPSKIPPALARKPRLEARTASVSAALATWSIAYPFLNGARSARARLAVHMGVDIRAVEELT